MYNSYFEGKLRQYVMLTIIGGILTFISLGLLFPWVIVRFKRWEMSKTVIDGRRLVFIGTATSLVGNWIKWLLLTIITLGIYTFWLNIKMKQWVTKNTHFADGIY